MKIRPFVLIGKSMANAFETSFQMDVDAWSSSWLGDGVQPKVAVSPIYNTAEDLQPSFVMYYTDADEKQWAVCAMSNADQLQLGGLLLGSKDLLDETPSDGGIADGLIGAALVDLIRKLQPLESGEYVQQDTTGDALLPDKAYQPGCEAIEVTVNINRVTLYLWIPVLSVLSRVEASQTESTTNIGAMVKVGDAIGRQKLGFQISLGGVELDLGTVAKLKTGDVIRLDKELQAPLLLAFNKSSVQFSGYLGKQDGCYAFLIDSLQDDTADMNNNEQTKTIEDKKNEQRRAFGNLSN